MLKGARCDNPPGMHSWRRGRPSEYGVRLREKQKVKRFYGIFERQFMRYFKEAERVRANTGAALLSLLERRLDNVVYKLGFAPSRAAARMTITHGHIYLNGRRMNVPSYLVRTGDKVTIKPSDKAQNLVRRRLEELGEPQVQNWLSLDMTKLEGGVLAMPTRDDVTIPVEENLIVELCSR
jgi:small subunit ribosomal protein S4